MNTYKQDLLRRQSLVKELKERFKDTQYTIEGIIELVSRIDDSSLEHSELNRMETLVAMLIDIEKELKDKKEQKYNELSKCIDNLTEEDFKIIIGVSNEITSLVDFKDTCSHFMEVFIQVYNFGEVDCPYNFMSILYHFYNDCTLLNVCEVEKIIDLGVMYDEDYFSSVIDNKIYFYRIDQPIA